ncbi:MAG: hypothetical protein ACI8WB_006159 [Phenylobacterium sp.]|jgi:hypothetical protein
MTTQIITRLVPDVTDFLAVKLSSAQKPGKMLQASLIPTYSQ